MDWGAVKIQDTAWRDCTGMGRGALGWAGVHWSWLSDGRGDVSPPTSYFLICSCSREADSARFSS